MSVRTFPPNFCVLHPLRRTGSVKPAIHSLGGVDGQIDPIRAL